MLISLHSQEYLLKKLAEEVLSKLQSELNIDLVSCYPSGSLVRGYFTNGSDLDLKIVAKSSDIKKFQLTMTERKSNTKVDVYILDEQFLDLAIKNLDFKIIESISNEPLSGLTYSELLNELDTDSYLVTLQELTLDELLKFKVSNSSKDLLRHCYHSINLEFIKITGNKRHILLTELDVFLNKLIQDNKLVDVVNIFNLLRYDRDLAKVPVSLINNLLGHTK